MYDQSHLRNYDYEPGRRSQASSRPPKTRTPAPKATPKRSWLIWIIAAVVLVVLIVVAIIIIIVVSVNNSSRGDTIPPPNSNMPAHYSNGQYYPNGQPQNRNRQPNPNMNIMNPQGSNIHPMPNQNTFGQHQLGMNQNGFQNPNQQNSLLNRLQSQLNGQNPNGFNGNGVSHTGDGVFARSGSLGGGYGNNNPGQTSPFNFGGQSSNLQRTLQGSNTVQNPFGSNPNLGLNQPNSNQPSLSQLLHNSNVNPQTSNNGQNVWNPIGGSNFQQPGSNNDPRLNYQFYGGNNQYYGSGTSNYGGGTNTGPVDQNRPFPFFNQSTYPITG